MNPHANQLRHLRFSGTAGEYFKIWIVSLLLTVLTLGIYSAWAKVKKERYFHNNTWLGEHTFEYSADPVAILKGRLLVVALFAIISLASTLSPWVGTLASLALVGLTPWLVIKTLQFRRRNVRYRDVPFNFGGEWKGAAMAFLLWPFLSLLTLGALLPYTLYLQQRYLVENTTYGTTPFTFQASPGDFYWLTGITVLLACGGIGMSLGLNHLSPVASGLLLATVSLLAFCFWRVQWWNLVFGHTALGDCRLRCQTDVRELMWLYFTNGLGIALTLGLLSPWAKVRLVRYRVEKTAVEGWEKLERSAVVPTEQTSATGEVLSETLGWNVDLLT